MRTPPFLLSLMAVCFATVLPQFAFSAYPNTFVSYEVRRGTSSDFAESILVGITTKTHFLDTTANSNGEGYYYFLRAVPGTKKSIRYFGGNVPADIFIPATSSESVPDLVYFTQRSSFSPTFYLLESDNPDPSLIVWPETEELRTEVLHDSLPEIPFLLRFKFDTRLYTTDPDQTAELVAYDPFTETIISNLGTVKASTAIDWQSSLTLENLASGVYLEWNQFSEARVNSTLVSDSLTREIADPTPPESFTASAEIPTTTHLNWETNLTAASYSIYRSTNAEFAGSTKIAANIAKNKFTDSSVEAGVQYNYWITSENPIGESDPSTVATVLVPVEEFHLSLQSDFGKVTLSPDQAYYADGDSVTLSADPHPGYAIDHWTVGEETLNEAAPEITVSADTKIVAHYKLDVSESYLNWIAAATDHESIYFTGPDRDADGDGLTNNVEWALGTDGVDSVDTVDFEPLHLISESTAEITLYANPANKQGRVWVALSTDLKTWKTAELLVADDAWTLDQTLDSDLQLVTSLEDSESNRWKLSFQIRIQNAEHAQHYLRFKSDL